jgi:hypothetical protein
MTPGALLDLREVGAMDQAGALAKLGFPRVAEDEEMRPLTLKVSASVPSAWQQETISSGAISSPRGEG